MATYKTLTNRPPTSYHKDTPEALQMLLEGLIHSGKRVRLFYGHTEKSGGTPGQDWHEENDVSGYLGRSGGSKPIVILLPTQYSSGGPGILDDCIVRLLVDGREVYRHPLYRNGLYDVIGPSNDTELPFQVQIDRKEYANFTTLEKAKRYTAFMRGERMTK